MWSSSVRSLPYSHVLRGTDCGRKDRLHALRARPGDAPPSRRAIEERFNTLVQIKEKWRRGRDSNPRWSCPHSGLANRRTRPLCDLSKASKLYVERVHERSTCRNRWRRERDSNPRGSSPGCFQDSCLQPLGHPSTYSELYTSVGVAVKRRGCRLHPIHVRNKDVRHLDTAVLTLVILPDRRQASSHGDARAVKRVDQCGRLARAPAGSESCPVVPGSLPYCCNC